MNSFIHAMHLFSPSLPIGAFAFSQGLEAAIEANLVKDERDLENWCLGVLQYSMRTLDFRYARASYRATSKIEWTQINAAILASRETKELLLEDQLLGMALKKWACQQGVEVPDTTEYSLIALYGWIGSKMKIPEDWVVTGIGWSWLDNQMVVAAKSIPLGQTVLQRVVSKIKPVLSNCVQDSIDGADMPPASTVPMLTTLSALHETQYSRLFRS